MRKIFFSIGMAIFCSFPCFAQSLNQSVISSAGDISATRTIVLEWTLGETMTEPVTTSSYFLTQGFHQSFLLKKGVLSITDDLLSDLSSIVVNPNPVNNYFIVQVNISKPAKLEFFLTDPNGKLLQTFSANNKSDFYVNMQKYTAGVYLFRVIDTEHVSTRTFKIVKIH